MHSQNDSTLTFEKQASMPSETQDSSDNQHGQSH
jgi:hypothetical protein